MLVRIQSDPDKIIPHHFDASSALFGAADSGYRWKYITYSEVENGSVDLAIPNNLYVGSVEFMLENGEVVVIEYNDMWAIGNYGIDNSTYFHLLRKRYFEIINKNINI